MKRYLKRLKEHSKEAIVEILSAIAEISYLLCKIFALSVILLLLPLLAMIDLEKICPEEGGSEAKRAL
jgi:hypothetical protein